MKIYHYTSIQTLALILHYKTMRFNRLDRVDDVEEAAYGSGPYNINLSQYHFVSCWTKSNEENLALWNMYTRYKGVRIGLESVPFKTYKVNDKFTSLLKSPMKFGTDYFASSFNNPTTLYDIEYVDNPKEKVAKLAIPTNNGGMIFDTTHVGIYKRKEWAMQQESRFKLNVSPVNYHEAFNALMKDPSNPTNVMIKLFDSIGPSLGANKPISTKYIDLPLDEDKLQHIEVMLGPLTTVADRIIVESLVKPYSNSNICESIFKGKIGDKR